jgi:hypothetical protein
MWPLAPAIHPVSSGSQGWRWVLGFRSLHGVRSCSNSPLPPLPSPSSRHGVVTWPLAPAIPPASSGSQGWGQVLGFHSLHGVRLCSNPPHPPHTHVITWCGEVAISTRNPPCKQWLAGLGVGAGLPFVAWRSFMLQPSPPSPPLTVVMPWCGDVAVSTCDLPCKQWLTGLGVGAGSSFIAWCLRRFLSFFVVLCGCGPFHVGFHC